MAQYRVMLQMPYTPGIASVFDNHPEIAVDIFTETSEANIVQHVGNYDAAILGVAPFTPAIIAGADKMKVVCRHGVGYDAVNVPALTKAGIPLAVVGIANSITVAEHSLFFMMALAKRGGDGALNDADGAAAASPDTQPLAQLRSGGDPVCQRFGTHD